MRSPVLLAFAALAAWLGADGPGAAALQSQRTRGGHLRPMAMEAGSVAADTLLWRNLLAPRPTASGDLDPSALPPLRLGLKPVHGPWSPEWPAAPGLDHPLLQSPLEGWGRRWGRLFDRYDAPGRRLRLALADRARRFREGGHLATRDFLPPDTARPGFLTPRPLPPIRAEAADTTEIPSFVSEYADLGMRVQARTELGGDWTRYRPCESQFQESCNPRALPQLSPDIQFKVEVGGTISDRIHVDVDFDQTREFEATNRINMYYAGAPDDVVRRLEVGDVTFRLPASRFVTEGIPAGNFGFLANGQLGPLDFEAVWAEQKGDLSSRVFRLTGVGNQRRFVQEDTLVLDDADFVRGQFFFLVDPESIDEHPHIDVLSLDPGSAPATVLPGVEPVQLYRFENDPIVRQQVEGFIQADAVAERDGERLVEAGWFRYLQPGQDYFIHPSGLWIALRNPLAREEMLAVTYVTAAGDTVGDYNPERIYITGGRPELRLLKASAANHQPGRPTWDQEMHNIYRVSGSPDVEAASVEVTVSLGELSAGRTFKRTRTGEDMTFLRLFGLDSESPVDEVDRASVYQPGRDVFQDQPPVDGTFVVFPTLEPFLDPPPLPGLGYTEEETEEILGEDANAKIYRDGDPYERENGGRFRLTIPFRVRSEGLITSFGLGALGIREGSERIYLGDRLMVRGVDYQIDYDVGQVTLTEPELLFATTPDAEVRATWEQKQIFQTAPISVFGVGAHARLGDRGGLDFIGLYRNEKTLMNRPTLGIEPGAIGLGGLNGRYQDGVEWLDRALAHVPGLRYGGESSFRIDGEAALSLPDPNTRGEVFLDDFDASNERPLSLLAADWNRGSAPAFTDGAEQVLPPNPSAQNLAGIVWQSQWILEGVGGDSLGIHEGFFPRQEIDQQIRVAGSQIREPGMLVTFGDGPFNGTRWGSVTTVLSQTGTDLTKSEFLEFYAAGADHLELILDLGTVSEDAMFVAPDGATQGTKSNGVPWGLDRLDHEADPALGQIWGNEADERGVWGETCLAERGRIYRVGDRRAVCTRGNGRRDSEDLDSDGNLDTREKYLRYVVDLGPTSPYLARSRSETGSNFRLYRIPLEGLGAREVGGVWTEADMRAVRHLRVTVAGERRGSLMLARLNIVGSRWVKRTEDGVLRGIVGDTAAMMGRVEVTPVSRITEGEGYNPPPGVLEQLSDPTSAIAGQGVEFNEKSLAVRFQDVQPGDRAEVYSRFPQRPRNFLAYRTARFWVVSRAGDFHEDQRRSFFLKIGSDADNFYIYRQPLKPPASAGVAPEDWLPEAVVDFGRFFELRRQAEEILIRFPRAPGDPPVAVWSADSTYAVVLRDRGRAPDLANVREMALGVWNESDAPMSGEVWVNELRLGDPVRDAGLAGFLDATLDAADVLSTRVTFSGRGAFFRQLDEDPTYQTDRVTRVTSQLRLERLTPAEWGVELPLRFTYDKATQDPTFLANSDLRADRLAGLRPIGSSRTRLSLGFRKSTPAANPIVGALLNGLNANLGWFSATNSSISSQLDAQGVDARLGYTRRLDRRAFDLVPSFLEPVVRALLPRFLEERLVDLDLRWSPERFSVGTNYLRHDNDILRFQRIIEGPEDSLVTPTHAPREAMENVAELNLRPFQSLTADLTVLSTRDLLDAREVVTDDAVQRLIEEERAGVMGMDLGWETHRVLRTRVGFRPRVFTWLSHSVDWTTSYLSDRNPSFIEHRPDRSDLPVALTRNTSGERDLRAFASLDLGGMARAMAGVRDEPGPGGEVGAPEPVGGGVGDAVADSPVAAGDSAAATDSLVLVADSVVLAADSLVLAADSLVPVADSVVPVADSVVPVADSVVPVADSLGAAPDSLGGAPDSTAAVEDSAAAAELAEVEGPGASLVPAPQRRRDPLLVDFLELFRPVTFNWQDGITSRFNREAVNPGLGYQFGLGSVDDFRFLDEDTAATVTDRTAWRVGTGITLPVGLDVSTAYAISDADVLDPRSDRSVTSRTWPDVSARLSLSDVGGRVDRFSLASGYQVNEREITFGGAAQQLRVQTDRQIPVDLTVGWAGSVTTSYRAEFRTGDGVDPTGDTERDRTTHSLSFTSTFVPPWGVLSRLERPVRLLARLSHTEERECRVARFRLDCVPFIDQRNRGLSVALDTSIRGFEVGLQSSWTERQSFVGLNTGSTQFQLGLFGQFLFQAGVIPGR